MVTRTVTFLICNLALATLARGDLHLTPRPVEYELDGVRFTRLVFSDDSGKEVSYTQPRGWDASGSATKFATRPPRKLQAEGTITTAKLAVPGAFDEESTSLLAKEALASIPAGSTDVLLVSQERNPVFIGDKETFLVVASYSYLGEKFQRSVLFLNRPALEQVRFQFVSHASDFEELQRAFLASLFSIQNL